MDQAWLTAALVGVTVLHAVVLFASVRTRRARRRSSEAAVDGDGLACTDCGAENEPGFRYCGACVAELPGTGAAGGGGGATADRRTL